LGSIYKKEIYFVQIGWQIVIINQQQQYQINPFNKKSWSNTQQPKPKMSNSFKLLTGPIETIQKKYVILSDIVSEYNSKVHGCQSHIAAISNISLIIYYEVPEGKREEVKKV
jgi:hypothetical protein